MDMILDGFHNEEPTLTAVIVPLLIFVLSNFWSRIIYTSVVLSHVMHGKIVCKERKLNLLLFKEKRKLNLSSESISFMLESSSHMSSILLADAMWVTFLLPYFLFLF